MSETPSFETDSRTPEQLLSHLGEVISTELDGLHVPHSIEGGASVRRVMDFTDDPRTSYVEFGDRVPAEGGSRTYFVEYELQYRPLDREIIEWQEGDSKYRHGSRWVYAKTDVMPVAEEVVPDDGNTLILGSLVRNAAVRAQRAKTEPYQSDHPRGRMDRLLGYFGLD